MLAAAFCRKADEGHIDFSYRHLRAVTQRCRGLAIVSICTKAASRLFSGKNRCGNRPFEKQETYTEAIRQTNPSGNGTAMLPLHSACQLVVMHFSGRRYVALFSALKLNSLRAGVRVTADSLYPAACLYCGLVVWQVRPCGSQDTGRE